MSKRMLLTQAAAELGVTPHFLRLEAKAGRIPYIMAGNRYIFDVEQCEQFLKAKALENMESNNIEDGRGQLRRVKE